MPLYTCVLVDLVYGSILDLWSRSHQLIVLVFETECYVALENLKVIFQILSEENEEGIENKRKQKTWPIPVSCLKQKKAVEYEDDVDINCIWSSWNRD